jgi:hypothetical protein
MQQTEEFLRSFRSLDGMKYQPKIDYSHKRGLVEEINRAVQSVEEDVEMLRALHPVQSVRPGAI